MTNSKLPQSIRDLLAESTVTEMAMINMIVTMMQEHEEQERKKSFLPTPREWVTHTLATVGYFEESDGLWYQGLSTPPHLNVDRMMDQIKSEFQNPES